MAITGFVALAPAALQAAGGVPGPAGGLTVPRAERRSQARGAPSITGKLAAVTNRIVDRGELSVPGEGASLSEHAVRPDKTRCTGIAR